MEPRKYGNLKEEIDKAGEKALRWEKMAENKNLSREETNKWLEARKVWLEKDSIHTGILRQRARIKWHAEGDENSILFHNMVRKRSRKRGLVGLLVDGQ